MSLATDLRASKALISNPDKWGKRCHEDDAEKCCAILATKRAIKGEHESAWAVLQDALPEPWLSRSQPVGNSMPKPMYAGYWVGRFNDSPTTTHSDIMALFDRAIAAVDTAADHIRA